MKKILIASLCILFPLQVMAWKHLNYLTKSPESSIAYKFIKNQKIKFCNNTTWINDLAVTKVIYSWLDAGLNNVSLSTSAVSECNETDIIIGEMFLPVDVFGEVIGSVYINPYDKAEMLKNISNSIQKAKDKFANKAKYSEEWDLIETLEHFAELVASVKTPSIFVNNTLEAKNAFTTRRTLIHEIGHAFGMGDEDEDSPSKNFCDATNQSSIRDDSSVMSYKNENEFLSAGDKKGIAKIFESLGKK